MIPDEYKLTDEEIREAVYSYPKENSPSWPKNVFPRDRVVANAATKKVLDEIAKLIITKLEKEPITEPFGFPTNATRYLHELLEDIKRLEKE